jgi:hypothetical protein
MPKFKTFRFAWMALVILALPAIAQDPQAAPPADDPAVDAAVPDPDAEVSVSGEPPADTRALDETVQDLKKDVVDLNKELFVLEE